MTLAIRQLEITNPVRLCNKTTNATDALICTGAFVLVVHKLYLYYASCLTAAVYAV